MDVGVSVVAGRVDVAVGVTVAVHPKNAIGVLSITRQNGPMIGKVPVLRTVPRRQHPAPGQLYIAEGLC